MIKASTASKQKQKQKQGQDKQVILNNYVNELLQYESSINENKSKISKIFPCPKLTINLIQFYDLLIWIQKKKPQSLMPILQMDILKISIQLVSGQKVFKQIKAYIVLINNCKINGQIINYLLVHYLINTIIMKYLKSIQNNNNVQIEQQLEYLGSLLKAYNLHLNQKTYPYYINYIDKNNNNNNNNNKSLNNKNKIIKKQFNTQYKLNDNQSNNFIDQNKQKDLTLLTNSLLDYYYEGKSQNQQNNKQQECNNKFQETQIQQKQCLLIKICCRFYNCPQQLTKITVMNILMNILRQPFSSYLIYSNINNHDIYANNNFRLNKTLQQWSYNLCCQFRNTLKDMNQQLSIIKSEQQQKYLIEQINDNIIFWEDLTLTQHKQIYQQNFKHLILYSLIIGSLNTLSLPMFNIKFSFFILSKMLKIIINLDLFKSFGQILFTSYKIQYIQSWISTAVMKGFNINKINDDQYQSNQHLYQDQQKHTFSGTNQFYLNMLKSKDQQFLKISLNLLQQIILNIKKESNNSNNKSNDKNNNKNKQIQQYYLTTLKLGPNNVNLIKISSILINQLKFDHSIQTLKYICENIIYLQPLKHLTEDNSNQFVYFYSQLINDTIENIQKSKQCYEYIVQTFQYDMRILQLIKFNKKVFKDKQLLIHPAELEIQTNINKKVSFYNTIPETPNQILRYKIIKVFLLLKLKQKVIQYTQLLSQSVNINSSKSLFDSPLSKSSINNQSNDSTFILTNYVKKLEQWQKKQIVLGDILPLPVKTRFHQCSLIQDKTQIPCVLLQDDIYLTIGFVQQMKGIKIIVNVKFKHITTELFTKKDKVYIKVNLHKFDFETQNIVYRGTILLRNLQSGSHYFAVKKDNFKQKQIISIKKGLIRTQQSLPQISLL